MNAYNFEKDFLHYEYSIYSTYAVKVHRPFS
jgi:hypothetical protein